MKSYLSTERAIIELQVNLFLFFRFPSADYGGCVREYRIVSHKLHNCSTFIWWTLQLHPISALCGLCLQLRRLMNFNFNRLRLRKSPRYDLAMCSDRYLPADWFTIWFVSQVSLFAFRTDGLAHDLHDQPLDRVWSLLIFMFNDLLCWIESLYANFIL